MASQQTLEILLKIKAETNKALKQLDDDMKGVRDSTDKTAAAFGGLSGASFKFNQITQALGTVYDVSKRVAGAFIDMGARGADVADLEAQFNLLNQQLGNTGDVIGTLANAFDGTVSNFDIMKSVNLGLSQGLKLTEDQMKLTAETARVLADRTGGDAKTAFEQLNQVMATGADRGLKLIGLNIDATAAVEKYAQALGVEASKLTEAQQIEAKREAVLVAMKQALDASGRASVDFADRVEQAKVGVQNLTDSLGKAIATSPAVNAGMDAIAKAIEGAFGGNSQQAVDTMGKFVNDFAIVIGKGASAAVTATQVIYEGWNYALLGAKAFASGVAGYLDNVVQGLRFTMAAFAAIPGAIGEPFRIARESLGETSAALRRFGQDALISAETQVQSFAKGNVALGNLKTGVDAVVKAMESARAETGKTATAMGDLGDAATGTGQKLLMDAEKRADALRLIAKASAETLEKFGEDALKGALERMPQFVAIEEEKADAIDAIWDDLVAKEDARGQQIADARKRAAEDQIAAWEAVAAKIDDVNDVFGAMAGLLNALGVSSDSTIGKMVGGLQSLGNAAKQGFAAFTQFSSGNILGGITSGLGALGSLASGVKSFFGGLFGGASKAREELLKLRSEFVQGIGGMAALEAKAKQAGVSLKSLFRAESASQLQAAIARIKGELDTWGSAHEKLQKAVEKYGFTLEELGPKFQAQQLDTMAQELLSDWTLLVASGIDVANVATRMADSLNDMAAKARATGQSLPENLRPIYEELLRQGKLVDENGNAYGSLEEAGLSFTQSLTDGMKELVEEIKRMVAAITGVRIPPIRVAVEYDDPGYGGGGGGHHAPAHGGEFPGNATGGYYDRPQLAWMAEAGPARAQGEFAIPREMLQQMLNQAARAGRDGGSNGRGSIVVNVGGRQVWQEFSEATRRGALRVHPNATSRGGW